MLYFNLSKKKLQSRTRMQIWIKYAIPFFAKGNTTFYAKGNTTFMQKGTLANTLSNVLLTSIKTQLSEE